MNIKEKNLSSFKENISNSKLDYPKSNNQDLFNLFFNYLGVGSRGSGKTYNVVKIIKQYENEFMTSKQGEHKIRTILISPTYDANKNLWGNLKSLNENDIYESYSEDILQDIIDDINEIIEEVKFYNLYVYYYKIVENTHKKDIKKLLDENEEILDVLRKFDFKNPSKIKNNFRYTTKPITFIILDDIMGSDALNRKSKNLLVYWLIKNRHIFTSFFILVQSMKSVPKSIRINCNLFYLAKFSNKKAILNDLYEEVSSIITEKQFENIYDKAINEGEYGSLIIDLTGKKKRFYSGLNKELII
mgnify:CR=1 FL=1